jgi:hypothetical protein
MTTPPAGVLEELDGQRLGAPPAPRRAVPWSRALTAASITAVSRPRLWVFALLAFLARGGLVVLVIPMIVLPSFVGLSNIVGPTSVTAAGPTPRLVALVGAWLGVTLLAILGGTLVGAGAEVALYRATVAPGADWARRVVRPSPEGIAGAASARGAALRVAVLRLALLLPVALAVAAAVPAWVQVAYRELLLPSDLAVPLPIRVVAGAPIAAALVIATWLATEVLGGLAARRVSVLGWPVAPAFRAAIGDVVRAPVPILMTLGAGIGGTLLVLVPATAAVGFAAQQAWYALVDGTNAVAIIVGAMALVAAWAVCVVVAGAAAAWRSVLVTEELARHARVE